MPSFRDFYPKQWLTAEDLQGKTVNITITKVEAVTVRNPLTHKEERKPAASFKGKEIRMTLNKTNSVALAKLAGTEDYTQWRNILVSLRPDTAPNGKATIVLGAPVPKQAQPAAAAQAEPVVATEMHGQVHGPVHGLVHGLENPAPVHGPVHGLVHGPVHGPDDDADFVPDEPGEEVSSAITDPKSAGAGGSDREPAQDALFFSVADLSQEVRRLHIESDGPMTHEQHVYIDGMMRRFAAGKEPAAIWKALLPNTIITETERAGALVGRYLYDLMREEVIKYPAATDALHNLCETL